VGAAPQHALTGPDNPSIHATGSLTLAVEITRDSSPITVSIAAACVDGHGHANPPTSSFQRWPDLLTHLGLAGATLRPGKPPRAATTGY
jgi:hypothetical protein